MAAETNPFLHDGPLGASDAPWLGFADFCQAAVGRHVLEGGRPSALMATVLTAAAELRTRESRELGRLLVLKVAIRLDRSLGTAGVAALTYQLTHGGPALRATIPATLARMLPEAPPVDECVGTTLRHVGATVPSETGGLSDLARRMNVSRSRLSQRVFQQTGITFTGHVKLARMNLATRLLQETRHTVRAVAIAVGYAHAPNLDKQFRSHFHITPSQFRRLLGTSHTRSRPEMD